MERKLASIRRVTKIRPIEGADFIEAVEVGGWTVVVKKDTFKVGDLCVYFEIDAFLPAENPAFAFLEDQFHLWNNKRGMRLKTKRLKKTWSQGLALPISDFAELKCDPHTGPYIIAEGDDVTQILKIEKWESPEDLAAASGDANRTTRSFPSFIRKTDQERVQNRVNEVAERTETFERTIKLDGSSMTVYILWKDNKHFEDFVAKRNKSKNKNLSFWGKLRAKIEEFFGKGPEYIVGVCSRNQEVDINGSTTFATYVRDNKVEEKLVNLTKDTHDSYAFQGELLAPSIQGNFEKVNKPEWYVYDVYSIDDEVYLLPLMARLDTAAAGLKYVPVLEESATIPEGDGREAVDKILAAAEGPGMNPGVKREGEVWKSNEVSDFSFKAISNSYLLKKG